MPDIILFMQHHAALGIAGVLTLLLLVAVELLRAKRGAGRVSPAQLTQMINHQQAVVADLRPTELYTKGHIIGSMSLPLSEFKQKAKKLEKIKTQPIVLVCAKGLESPKVAATLQKQGLDVHILSGGISSWISADMPLTKG